MRPVCRHCKRNTVCRPRGLCWTCWFWPGVRERYGPVNKFGNRGSGLCAAGRKLPAVPTTALPGTSTKMVVMMHRAAAGVVLFHPEDARPC
jgi:hypothetical protein